MLLSLLRPTGLQEGRPNGEEDAQYAQWQQEAQVYSEAAKRHKQQNEEVRLLHDFQPPPYRLITLMGSAESRTNTLQ